MVRSRSNECGCPARISSSTVTPSPVSVSYISVLCATGTVASSAPWISSVGGYASLKYVSGLAARACSSLPFSPNSCSIGLQLVPERHSFAGP